LSTILVTRNKEAIGNTAMNQVLHTLFKFTYNLINY
jgi:hypothetical protein